MEMKILNKLSNLAFYGFYYPSKQMVTVHFFNEQEDKSDVIAYLTKDMSWDIREITDEVSILEPYCEYITVSHDPLGVYPHDGPFDNFIRKGLTKMAQEVHGKDANLSELDKMFEVFENNSYGKQEQTPLLVFKNKEKPN